MYIIKTIVLDHFNYYLSELKTKNSRVIYWNGLKGNGKKFLHKKDAVDFSFAETTLATEIISI